MALLEMCTPEGGLRRFCRVSALVVLVLVLKWLCGLPGEGVGIRKKLSGGLQDLFLGFKVGGKGGVFGVSCLEVRNVRV